MKKRRIRSDEAETEIEIPKYSGRNSFGRHQSLALGELRDCINWDIFPGKERDELKSRNGSAFIRPASGHAVWTGTVQRASVTWDTGTDEYEIVQVANQLYSQNLTTPANPVLIANFAAGAFFLGSSTISADMFIHGDRCFVIQSTGNYVVEWFSGSSTFKARAMGMAYPSISTLTSAAGSITGRYIYALEKVYQVAGVDILVSSPNRKVNSSFYLADTQTQENKKYYLEVLASSITDTLWTHIRLWRSKNLNPDNTDPLNPIDAQGLESELYEVALITRAELAHVGYAAVATGGALPIGNANVTAGLDGGLPVITDNNTDEALFNMIGLERIELIPLPAASCGCFHEGRIFVDGGATDDIRYSNQEGTKYSELCDPLNIIPTGRDGTLIKRLIPFERDLLVLKENKTGRVLGGDVNQAFEVLDHRIGISYLKNAEYLPGIGVCAVTADTKDFKIFTLGLTWTTTINGKEISRDIHNDIASASLANTAFKYCNGKIWFYVGTSTAQFFILHLQSGRGWTRYYFQTAGTETTFVSLFTFSGGSRIAMSKADNYTIELDVAGATTDVDSASGGASGIAIALTHTTHMYQSAEGRNILEFDWYSLAGYFNAAVYGTPYVNNVAWPAGTPVQTAFTLAYSGYTSSENRDGEYRLQLPTATVDSLLWQRFTGYFLHLKIETTAPATIRHEKMRVTVDGDDSSFLARTTLT